MAFQSTIRQFQAHGVVGEVIYSGPVRARGVIINTTTAANNVIGRALTYSSTNTNTDGVRVEAGGTGKFAGILTHSKQYASLGTAANGALAPTMTVPNNSIVEATYFATGILVELLTVTSGKSIQIGDKVYYKTATGELGAGASAPEGGSGWTEIVGAKVIDQNVTGPTSSPFTVLAIIELNS